MIRLKDILFEFTLDDIEFLLKKIENNSFKIIASKSGNEVGTLNFIKSSFNPVLIGTSVSVAPEFRRLGIGSSMYEFAEKEMTMKFIKSDDVLTKDGQLLWNNPNRKFGILKYDASGIDTPGDPNM